MRIFVSANKSMIIMDREAAERILHHVDIAYNELSEDDEIDENVKLGDLLTRCIQLIKCQEVLDSGTT